MQEISSEVRDRRSTNCHNDAVTPQRIQQIAFGYAPPLILEAGLKHRVFDVLDSGPKTIAEVAKETGTSIRGLSAIMNALVGLEFLAKDTQGRYSLTPESEAFLVSSKPSFQGGIVRHCSEHLIPKWLSLNEIVATGKPVEAVNEQARGPEFFKNFVADIFPMSYAATQALAEQLRHDGQSMRVLDIAAGSGVWGIGLAQGSPQVHVTALDWAEVLPVTREMVGRFGLTSQFSFIEGDLNKIEFGGNYTVATLGHILHSEGEERSRALLAKVYRALDSGGTIAIAEMLVNPDRTGPVFGLLFAVNMLVNTQDGDTFSFEEIGRWLEETGFVQVRTLDAPGPSPLILATRP